MASIRIEGLPVAAPAVEPWPLDNDPLSVQADEMFARHLDTEFEGEVRTLMHDPETGLAGKEPEEALIGIAEAAPKFGELKERYLAQAIGPRQRSILEPLIDSRLDRARARSAGSPSRRRPRSTTASWQSVSPTCGGTRRWPGTTRRSTRHLAPSRSFKRTLRRWGYRKRCGR